MATYAFRTPSGDLIRTSKLGKPTPAHALTPAALEAVESMRRLGHERRLRASVARLVIDHGNPKRETYDGVRITTAARGLAKMAEAAGFEVLIHDHPTGCTVEGLHRARRVGFRASWEKGAAKGGTWHSGGRDHWKLIDISSRPIGVDAKTKLTKAGCRHDENDTTRLVLVESPRGVRVNVTELKRRIKA